MGIINRVILASAFALTLGSVAHAQAYDSDPNQQNTEVSINGAESTTDRPTVLDGRSAFDGGPASPQVPNGFNVLVPTISSPVLPR